MDAFRLKYFIIVYSFVLTLLMSFGFLSNAHIGSLTWGPTTDIWAMSIAMSKINYNLEGGIGYKKVSDELAKYLTKNDRAEDFSQDTLKIVDDPEFVTMAMLAAADLSIKDILSAPLQNQQYVTTWAEDIGFADFYEIAFRLFGYDAYSTHYLYFTIMFLSLLLYILSYHQNRIPLIFLGLAATSLFLASTSNDIFSVSTPTFAANRFISTLTLIPFLHLVAHLFTLKSANRIQILSFIFQTFILAFTIRLRSSSSWILVSLGFIVINLISYHFYRFKAKAGFASIKRLLLLTIIIYTAIFSFRTYNSLQLDSIYFTEDLPHHMFWHSAWIGLSKHSDWSQKAPYEELKNNYGDGLAFALYESYMKKDPLHFQLSKITNNYKPRLHEQIVRKEYVSFAFSNPIYMVQLFFYYKPVLLFRILADIIISIPIKALLIGLVGLICVCFYATKCITARLASTILLFSSVTWSVSLLPVLWAYPAKYVLCDQTVLTLWLLLAFFIFIPSLLLNRTRN